MEAIAIAIWIASLVIIYWVYQDSKKRLGLNGARIWTIIATVLGPIGLIIYLVKRKSF